MPTVPLLRCPDHIRSGEPNEFWSPSRPPTPLVSALSEALSESILPTPPPQARLPPAFSPSRMLTRPPLLATVRCTYPTASLSATHSAFSSVSSAQSPTPPPKAPGILSSRTRSSVDTLRSIHVSSSAQFTASQSQSKWWFQLDSDNATKDSTENVLHQEDGSGGTGKKFRAPKAPLVFCHGLLGFDSVTIGPAIAPLQVPHWRGIKEVLEDNGCEVLITRVPATSSPIDRAKVLEKKLSETYPGRAVHLIVGIQQGGIDCRYLITHLTRRSFPVLSLTTIATPHRGSTFASHFLSLASTHLPAVLALLEFLPNGGGDGKAFECLTPEAMEEFNKNTPDVEGVRYFSWGAEYEPGLFDTWRYPHSIIYAKEGPNDGLVSVRSARWGTYLGTLEGVNHLDLVGWTDGIAGMRTAIQGVEVGFSPARFYLGVGDLLAGVEEEEGYVKDGVRVELEGRGAALEDGTVRPIAEGFPPIQRSSSDKARARMEEMLRQTPPVPSTPDEEPSDGKAAPPTVPSNDETVREDESTHTEHENVGETPSPPPPKPIPKADT
ncbi:alpha beta-hydrolase [Scleroderma citrinum]